MSRPRSTIRRSVGIPSSASIAVFLRAGSTTAPAIRTLQSAAPASIPATTSNASLASCVHARSSASVVRGRTTEAHRASSTGTRAPSRTHISTRGRPATIATCRARPDDPNSRQRSAGDLVRTRLVVDLSVSHLTASSSLLPGRRSSTSSGTGTRSCSPRSMDWRIEMLSGCRSQPSVTT